MPKGAQRQFLVSVAGIDGFFATKSGGNVSADVSRVWDGGQDRPELLPAPAEADNLTVGRPYDPDRDGPLLNSLRIQVGRFVTTVTVQPTDRDLAPVGDPQVFPLALLSSVNEPDTDAASGDVATLELEFTIGQYA